MIFETTFSWLESNDCWCFNYQLVVHQIRKLILKFFICFQISISKQTHRKLWPSFSIKTWMIEDSWVSMEYNRIFILNSPRNLITNSNELELKKLNLRGKSKLKQNYLHKPFPLWREMSALLTIPGDDMISKLRIKTVARELTMRSHVPLGFGVILILISSIFFRFAQKTVETQGACWMRSKLSGIIKQERCAWNMLAHTNFN